MGKVGGVTDDFGKYQDLIKDKKFDEAAKQFPDQVTPEDAKNVDFGKLGADAGNAIISRLGSQVPKEKIEQFQAAGNKLSPAAEAKLDADQLASGTIDPNRPVITRTNNLDNLNPTARNNAVASMSGSRRGSISVKPSTGAKATKPSENAVTINRVDQFSRNTGQGAVEGGGGRDVTFEGDSTRGSFDDFTMTSTNGGTSVQVGQGTNLVASADGSISLGSGGQVDVFSGSATDPIFSATNVQNFRLRAPGLATPLPLDQRNPVPGSANDLVDTLLKLSSQDVSMTKADSVAFLGSKNNNVDSFQGDLASKLYHIAKADQIKIGDFTLNGVKDATVLMNSKGSVFLADGKGVTGVVDGLVFNINTTSSKNAIKIPLNSTKKTKSLILEGATGKFPHKKGNVSDVIDAKNGASLTISSEFGFECAQFTPPGSYTFKTPEVQKLFSIAVVENPHRVCIQKGVKQVFEGLPKSCLECTLFDLPQRVIVSHGMAHYRRYQYQKEDAGFRLLAFTPMDRNTPIQTNRWRLDLDDTLERVKLASLVGKVHEEVLTVSSFLKVTDKIPDHRYLAIDPAVGPEQASEPIFDTIVSGMIPESSLLDGLWVQQDDAGVARIKVLFPGNSQIESMVAKRNSLGGEVS